MKSKKSSNKNHVSSTHHEKNARAILSLMVLLLAFGVFGIFLTNSDNILASESFKMFVVLLTAGFALLLGLLFLANPQKKHR